MSDNNVEEMMRMWREEPTTVRAMFPAGMAYNIQSGDTLANLGERFGIKWQSIAEATMDTSVPSKINSWLANNGGRKLKSGYFAFSDGQEIQIPPPPDDSVA